MRDLNLVETITEELLRSGGCTILPFYQIGDLSTQQQPSGAHTKLFTARNSRPCTRREVGRYVR